MVLLGTKRKLLTVFHLQTDGQTKQINQTIEIYLRYYINYKQNNWVNLLPLTQFIYNSTKLKGIGIISFFINYRYTLGIYQISYLDTAFAQKTKVQMNKLKSFHKELSLNIKFIVTWF